MSIAASSRTERLAAAMSPVQRMVESRAFARRGAPGVADFMVGNPQEMPLPAYVEALQRHVVPQNKDWFAYKTSEEVPQAFLARRWPKLLHLNPPANSLRDTNPHPLSMPARSALYMGLR